MQMSVRADRESLPVAEKDSKSLCDQGPLTGDRTGICDEHDSLRISEVVFELIPDARVTWDIDKAHGLRVLFLGRGEGYQRGVGLEGRVGGEDLLKY